jgi:hypothetical protein
VKPARAAMTQMKARPTPTRGPTPTRRGHQQPWAVLAVIDGILRFVLTAIIDHLRTDDRQQAESDPMVDL